MSWSDVDFEARRPDGGFDHAVSDTSHPHVDVDSSSSNTTHHPRHRRSFHGPVISFPLQSSAPQASSTTSPSSHPVVATSHSSSSAPHLFSFPNVMPPVSQLDIVVPRSVSNVSFSTVTTHEHESAHQVRSVEGSCNNIETSKYMDPEIYRATAGGDLDTFKRLLKNHTVEEESLWGQVSPQGNTILHLAAASGHLELVRVIIQNQKQLNMCRNLLGDLPLHVAASAGHLPVIKALLITGAGEGKDDDLLKQKNNEGDTPLHVALRKHHQETAEFLVKQDPRTSYLLNKNRMSPLYMAAESRYLRIVDLMMDHRNPNGQLKGKSLVHAALRSKDIDILNTILKKEPALVDSRNEQGMTPMFFAASTGYLDGVCKLIEHSTEQAYQRDPSGFYPIHIASYKGHVNIVKKLIEHCPDSMELLVSPMVVNSMESKKNKELLKQSGQNILHLAAKGGRAKVVSYLVKMCELESLINHKDLHGNTPLHLAVMNWHPKIVSILTWDSRVNLKLVNNDGFTALDIVERVPTLSTYRQRLTWMALLSAGAPRANLQSSTPKIPSNADKYNNRINTLLLMATLVATVTFAAGFTMPGGNANDPDQEQQQGMANLATNHMFQVFVTCDTIALYSSIVVAVVLIWAQQSDLYLVSTAFKFALPLLGITLTSMSLAFMAGVYLVVSNVKWLADFVLVTGLIFLASFLVLFVPLFLPYQSRTRIVRRIVYYPFCFIVLITGSDKY